jgi:F-type H+-transporting ATPase subunit b
MVTLTTMGWISLLAAAEAHGAEHAGGAKLPQLAVETFPGQLFWLAVTFGLLLVLSSYVILPRIGRVLAERAGRISGDIAAAALAKGEADQALQAYETALGEARARGRATADQTRDAVRTEIEKRRTEAEASLKAEQTAAEARIASIKSEALSNVRNVAAESAAAIVERLSGDSVTGSDAAAAVDAAMAR